MASRLGIPTAQATPVVEDVVFDIIRSQLSPTVSLPITKVMLETAQESWAKPSSVPISSKRLDHLYRTQEESALFLFQPPVPNSLVVLSSSKGRCQHSTPPDKEGKKLDAFSRRLYSAGSLRIKSCNYMACMARYIYAIFDYMAPHLSSLPTAQREHLQRLSSEGMLAAKQEIAYAKNTLESAAKTLTTTVALHRHS